MTGKELLGKVDPFRSMPNRFSGGELVQHWLAVDKVRFCGEAICAVVAEDRATAEDASELIKVDYDPLPAVTDPRLGERTARRWCTTPARTTTSSSASTSAATSTRRFATRTSWSSGSSASAASRRCAWKAAAASPRIGKTRSPSRVWMSHQLPYVVRHYLAKHLRLAENDVRVIIPHTGGGFGQKASIYPEEFVCAHLALALRRPVKWVEDRLENMVASTHARDQYIELELAVGP